MYPDEVRTLTLSQLDRDKRPLNFLHYHAHLAKAMAGADSENSNDLKAAIPLVSTRHCTACCKERSQAPPYHNSNCS